MPPSVKSMCPRNQLKICGTPAKGRLDAVKPGSASLSFGLSLLRTIAPSDYQVVTVYLYLMWGSK